jgi:osmotically-inducible protein OsmY
MSHIASTFVRGATGDCRHVKVGEFESNRSLTESVGRGLHATGRNALRGVVVEMLRDAVVLQGRVPSYYEKQLAQATAQQIAANRQVVNEIEVVCGPR